MSLLVLGMISFAQIKETSAGFAVDSALLGDHLDFNINVVYNPKGKIYLPPFKDTIGTFDILSAPIIDTSKVNNGLIQLNEKVKLFQAVPGNYSFSPIPILYVEGSRVDTFFTPTFSIFIKPIPLDSTDHIKPIKAPVNVPYTVRELLPWIIALLIFVLLVLAVILFFVYRHKKRQAAIVKPITPEEAHEVALRKLKELKTSKLWQEGKPKEYYDQMSEILRDYLEHRFNITAFEQTTEEIIASLRKKDISKSLRNDLQEVLRLADLAKFAKFNPLPDENINSLEKAIGLVQQTKPIIKPTQAK